MDLGILAEGGILTDVNTTLGIVLLFVILVGGAFGVYSAKSKITIPRKGITSIFEGGLEDDTTTNSQKSGHEDETYRDIDARRESRLGVCILFLP
jgi:hypothetical protein